MSRLDISSKEYLGTGEVARILNLSIGTIQGLVKSGKLQAWTTEGGHRRIYPASLGDYQKLMNMEVESTPKVGAKVGVLLCSNNQEKLEKSNFSPFFEIDYYKYEDMFHVISEYGKIKPNLLLIDYFSINREMDIELFKMLNKHCAHDKFFAIILIPQDVGKEKILDLSQFKNVLLLPDTENLSWLNGFICGLENPIALKAPKFRL